MPPQLRPQRQRRTAETGFLASRGMGAAQGKKVRRSSCGQAFEAQPSSGQTAMKRDPGGSQPEGRSGEKDQREGVTGKQVTEPIRGRLRAETSGTRPIRMRATLAIPALEPRRKPHPPEQDESHRVAGISATLSRTRRRDRRAVRPLIRGACARSRMPNRTGAPPIGRRQATRSAFAPVARDQPAAQRPTKGHSRKRPAGRAACARACGPAAALTPGRASVRRGKPKRATSGGSAGAASVRSADPRVPLTLGRRSPAHCAYARSGIRRGTPN